MRDRAWFVRMYGEITPELSRTGGQAMLYFVCTTISRVDHARYEVPYVQELGTCIWGPCYNSTLCATGINVICETGKNTNPRFRFKIKASYIVLRLLVSPYIFSDIPITDYERMKLSYLCTAEEGDVRRVTGR